MARYSTSTEDRDTTDCFLDFQEIKDEPRNMQKPETERLVSGHDAQSESQYAMRSKVLIEGKKRPCPGAPLRYFRTLNAAVK
jgi:hypothetical protein